MPRPQFVRDLLNPDRIDQIGEEALHRQLDAAVAYVVALQESAGLDIISDGEWRRLSYIGVIADILDGFDVFYKGNQPWTVCVDTLEPKHTGLVAKEARFVQSHSNCQAKVALPSPYLLGTRMWDLEKSKDAYPTREAFMRALVPHLRNELQACRDAGVRFVQFDDPHVCLFVDEKVRSQYHDPNAELSLAVDLLNEIVDGFDDLHTAIHLCRRNKARAGWIGEGGYGPIIDHLCRLNVDQYMLEFAIPVAGDFDVLAELPKDKAIGLGCVDCRGEHVDTADEIVDRVERALKHVTPDRITLHPDCGFAPGSAADIPIDEAYAKLKNEAAAAQILRQRHR
jgi:5-methyltetrahydropteroyltriglutamate--homocysteine methyltransferase